MKYLVRLSSEFTSPENKLIRLSNKFLGDSKETKKGIELLSKELNIDFSQLIKRQKGDYEKIRQRLINAKNAVLSFDMFSFAAAAGSTGFYNNSMTKKKTGQEGFSAEFKMADKTTVEKRAQDYKQSENLRKGAFISFLTFLAAFPLLIKKGLVTKGKFGHFVKKYADKFDYVDGIFIKRLPFLMSAAGMGLGFVCASRNQTELKDNLIRNGTALTVFFGGDIIIGSALAGLSDKFLKTNIIKNDYEKTIFNRLIKPLKPLKELSGRSKKIAAGLFWLNILMLSGIIGFLTPFLINRMIKKDVGKDVSQNRKDNNFLREKILHSEIFKEFKK